MYKYGKIGEKDDDDPDPKDLTPCGQVDLRSDKSAQDGINSSLLLNKGCTQAVDAEPGDEVLLYVEANDRWVAMNRKLYSDRAGVGLPMKARQVLDLNLDDTVHVWLGEWESPDKESNKAESKTDESRQESLDDRQVARDDFVWIIEESDAEYHHIWHDRGAVTACGVEFGDLDYKTLSDPGDVLEECEECEMRAAGDMTNRDLVEWIATEERGNFEVSDEAPAYLNKPQLMSIRSYIIDLEQKVKELQSKPEDETSEIAARS